MPNTAPTTDIDEELLRRIAAGQQEAVGGFYDRHAGTLLAVAIRVLGDRAAAEDVVQEVFVQIWQRAADFDRSLGRPLGWAVVMTRNRAIDRLRARIRGDRLAEQAAADPTPDDGQPPPGDNDRGAHVRGVLAELPAEQRSVIELAFFGGLTQTEIAERLGEPLGTIKARIRRGMLRMQEKLRRIL